MEKWRFVLFYNYCCGIIKKITLFVFIEVFLFIFPSLVSAAPLIVHPTNPRYFSDGSGRAIYLTSAYTGKNLQDIYQGGQLYEWDRYLDYLKSHNLNLVKFVIRERGMDSLVVGNWINPTIYQRTGPGLAVDGGLKYDLTKLNQAFFDRLRSRVQDSSSRGLYVVVMFFNGFDVHCFDEARCYWETSPFKSDNNINGINGDVNHDGRGRDTQSLPLPPGIEAIQRTRIRKIIDTVNGFDNVIYEVCNEAEGGSDRWQEWVMAEVRTYQSTKPKQHLIGMSWQYPNGDISSLWNSSADWISPGGSSYKTNPPVANGNKIIVHDNDHTGYTSLEPEHVWKTFTRGMHPVSIETWDSTFGLYRTAVHRAMQQTQNYAQKMDLASMVPSNSSSHCSTRYCLRNPGQEYLIYQPGSGSFQVNLAANQYLAEWLNPGTGDFYNGGFVDGGSTLTLTPPFSGQAILYLKSTSSPTPIPSGCPTRSDGDLNCDGLVNILDLVLVGANFGTSSTQGDVNGDGLVNIFDLVLVGSNFGKTL